MFKYQNRGISKLIVIGIIAVLIIVVGGGILGYKYLSPQKNNNQLQNQQQTPNNQTNNTQPSVTVTSPVGGETWKIGETHNIAWITSGMSPNINVCISFDDHNFGRLVNTNTIACVPSSQGYYSWTILALMQEAQVTDNPTGKVSSVGSQWKVNIVCDGNQNNQCGWEGYGFGQSANYFSIVGPN